MAKELEKLKSYLGTGARPNFFRVVFTQPAALAGPGATGERLSYMVKSASIPSKSITPIEIPYQGMKAKIGGDPTFPDWTAGFWNAVDFGAWVTMYAWSELVRTTLTNGGSPPSAYKAPILVQQLDMAKQPIHSVTLFGAWPSELGEVTLDTSTESTIEEFTTTFSYDYWTVVPNV